MLRAARILLLVLAASLAAPASGLTPAIAVPAGATADTGALRLGAYLVRRFGGWIVTLAFEIYDHFGGSDPPPPPPPPPPDQDPPIHDPDYTP